MYSLGTYSSFKRIAAVTICIYCDAADKTDTLIAITPMANRKINRLDCESVGSERTRWTKLGLKQICALQWSPKHIPKWNSSGEIYSEANIERFKRVYFFVFLILLTLVQERVYLPRHDPRLKLCHQIPAIRTKSPEALQASWPPLERHPSKPPLLFRPRTGKKILDWDECIDEHQTLTDMV